MGKNIEKAEKIVEQISYYGSIISSWGLFVLMCFGVLAVVLRKIGIPIGGSINLTVYALVAVVYLSIAHAQAKGEHVAVEFVYTRLRGNSRFVVTLIALLLSIAACSFMLWSSGGAGLVSLVARERMDGAPFYPIYPSKVILVIGVALLWIQLWVDLLKAVRTREK